MRRTQHTKKLDSQAGLTIVELVVVIVILAVIFPLFAFILSMYKDTYYLNDKVRMDAETTQAFDYMDDNVRSASAFMATVPSQYSDTYGRNNNGTAGAEAWSYKGGSATSRVLMTSNYATTANQLNTGRQPVFINTPAFDCSTQMYYQPQLTYVTIYFVKDKTLYKRILTDTTTLLCSGNVQQQKQTCPPYIAPGSWNAGCQANDEVLATNVTAFSMAYYRVSQAGVSTQIDASYTSTDPQILATADYAMVTVTKTARNGNVTSSMTQRMTKVNQ